METVISKTGQSWKLKTLFVFLVITGISTIYGSSNIDTLSPNAFFFIVAGSSIIGGLVFIFACISIKCPSCRAKWFWSAVSGKGNGVWLLWLNSLRVCPNCGEPKN